MNKVLFVFLFLMSLLGFSQNVLGRWMTIDDKTNEKKSVVDIYETEGIIFGKVIEVFNESDTSGKCTACKGEDNNQPIVGMTIIKNMGKHGDYYKGGTIVDPYNGNVYKLRLCLDKKDKDTLVVRGYLGPLYQTQYWKRLVE